MHYESRFGKGNHPDVVEALRLNLRPKNLILQDLGKWKLTMLEIKKECKGLSAKAYAKASKHVGEVQKIDFEFIGTLAKKLGLVDEVNQPSWRDYWTNGAETNLADLPPSGFFRRRDQPKRSMTRKATSWLHHPISIPKKPFKFEKRRNLVRAWQDFKKRLSKGKLIEITEEQISTCPIRSFGVEQGEFSMVEGIKIFNKLRSCWDFREGNSYCDQIEHLELWSIPQILNVVGCAMAGQPDLAAPVIQKKADLNFDLEREQQGKMDLKIKPEEQGEAENLKGRSPFCFIPLMAKYDKKAYYHQFATRDPKAVTYAMWDTDLDKFRYFWCKTLDFGSIHAVWWPVRVGTLNMRILLKMGIIAIVYIDDTILLLNPAVAKEQMELVELFYDLAGFEMSKEKQESHFEEKVLKVLGVNFERIPERGEMKVSIPEKKLNEARESLSYLEEELRKRSAKPIMFEKAHGKAVFCTSLGAVSNQGATRAVARWALKENFYSSLNKNGIWPCLFAVREARKALGTVQPLLISKNLLTRKVIRMITDAATPDNPAMGGMTAMGLKAWSWHWKGQIRFWAKIPALKHVKSHIGIWELMAVALNIVFFEADLRNCKGYFFVDNLGDVRILVKLTSNCEVCMAIARWISRKLFELKAVPYFIYIRTDRNPADFLTRLEKLEKIFVDFPEVSIEVNPFSEETISKIVDEVVVLLSESTNAILFKEQGEEVKSKSKRKAQKEGGEGKKRKKGN